MGGEIWGVPSGSEQLYPSGAVRGQTSCQFHALFRDFTHTLFAVPDIIPSTDTMEWERSDSGSDLRNISAK